MATLGFSVSTFLKNVGSGWIALLVSGAVSFISLPLMINALGEELYGVAALTTSLIAIFQYLSFGLPTTVLRFFSFALAKNDLDEVRKIASTSQFLLGSLGLVGAVGFLCSYPWFIEFYEIREDWRAELWILFLITAFNFAETFFLAPFFAVLQARNRYDLGNYNRVISSLLRLSVLWIGFRYWQPTLLTVSLAYFIEVLFRTVTIIVLALRIEGTNLVFRRKNVSLQLLPQFFSFSFLILIKQVFFGLSTQVPIIIVGKVLGKDMVAALSPSVLLSSYLMSVLSSISAPLLPLASQDKIKNDGNSLKYWTLILSEVLAWVGGAALVVIGVMSADLLELWVGKNLVWTEKAFCIMILGIVVAQIQTVNDVLATGASRIEPSAYSAVAMAILVILGVWGGTAYCGWSILGVAICIAVVRVLRNTFYLAFAYSRIFGYNYWNYTWRVYCKPMFYAVVVIVVARWLKANYFDYEPSFAFLIIGSAVVASVYGALGWYFNVDAELKKKLPGVHKIPKWGRKALRLPLD